MHVNLTNKVPIFADLWKKFKDPLDDGEQKGLSDLIEFTPGLFGWMIDLYPLLDGLNLKEEQIEGFALEQLIRH